MNNTNCNSRYLVLVRLLVTNHVCNVFEVELLSSAMHSRLFWKLETKYRSTTCMHALFRFKVGISHNLTPFDDFDQPLLPLASSRVSGESIGHMTPNLKSTLMSTNVMTRYLVAKEKLRKYMKLITLEDFQWYLRYSYHNFVGVVKVLCVECCKEFGSTTRDHSNNTINDLFANFY